MNLFLCSKRKYLYIMKVIYMIIAGIVCGVQKKSIPKMVTFRLHHPLLTKAMVFVECLPSFVYMAIEVEAPLHLCLMMNTTNIVLAMETVTTILPMLMGNTLHLWKRKNRSQVLYQRRQIRMTAHLMTTTHM